MEKSIPETSPDVEKLIIERYRQMTASEKLQQMCDLNAFVRDTQTHAVRLAYPDADERENRLRVASRWVRNLDLLKEAFGWDVSVEGY
jgi:hypothetical protein